MNKILFFILETLAIVFTGIAIKLEINIIFSLLMFLFLVKSYIGKPKHYGKMYVCGIWSYVVFVGLLFVAKADIFISILATFVIAYVTSEKSNIDNMYMFKRKNDSKYKSLDDFITFNYNDPRLLNYEDYLKSRESELYNYIKVRFRDKLTNIDKLEELFNKDRKYIYNKLDIVYYSLKEKLMLYDEEKD